MLFYTEHTNHQALCSALNNILISPKRATGGPLQARSKQFEVGQIRKWVWLLK